VQAAIRRATSIAMRLQPAMTATTRMTLTKSA
jgi:hypothetical protein